MGRCSFLPKLEKGLVFRAALFLMIVQVLSRILGYARDVVLLNMFGQSYVTDAYNAAFSIPDFLYTVLIGGAISCAFIPVFSSYIAKQEESEAWKVSSIFTSWILLLLAFGMVIAFIFTPELLQLLTDYTGDELDLPVLLTRITLVQALFMSLSAITTGILQSYQHFTWPAMGALFYNICIILGGVFLSPIVEAKWPGYGVAGFSIGVVIGSVITLAVQIPTLKKVGFRWHFELSTKHPGLRQLVKLIIPVLIGLSVAQINLFVTQKLATGLEDGVYTALRTANRFMQLPLGIFATAISTAIFPSMTAQAAVNDMPEMKKSLSLGVRTILFVTLPASVGMALLSEPIIRLMYEFSGKFTAADTVIAAEALVWYCVGLAGYAAVQGLIRGFYAIQNTVTPVVVSAMAIVINIAFSFLLVEPLGHVGLALAYSLAGIAQCVLLVIFLRRRIGPMDLLHMCKTIIQTLLACVVMAVFVMGASYGVEMTIGIAGKMEQLIQVALSIGVGVVAFFAVAMVMKMEEMQLVTDIIKRKLRRKH